MSKLIETIAAIDVHAHFGRYCDAPLEILNQFMSGSPQVVLQCAREAHVQLTIVSPLRAIMPRLRGDPLAANAEACQVARKNKGLLQWVVVDPTKSKTYQQAETMLKHPTCVGIKIHPEAHGYPIRRYGRALFEFAARQGTIIQTHSGEKNSLPADFVRLANDFPGVPLIISHLGCGWDNDPTHQVRAIQKSKHGNVYTDTSSAKSITANLLEWAVKEIGAEHILFGTDSPLYFAPMQRARVDTARISARAKQMILRENALRVLPRLKKYASAL